MRTKVMINGQHKITQSSITKPKKNIRQKLPTRKTLLLRNRIKQIVITLMRMIRTITCDIRTMYAQWMHTYHRLK